MPVDDAGAQWEKANEVFEEMQSQGCTPDVVTYTALISSYEKGGQWRRALQAYNQMRHQRCVPDSIVYNAIIDALWETGVIWAQRQVGVASNIRCTADLRALDILLLSEEMGPTPSFHWPPPLLLGEDGAA